MQNNGFPEWVVGKTSHDDGLIAAPNRFIFEKIAQKTCFWRMNRSASFPLLCCLAAAWPGLSQPVMAQSTFTPNYDESKVAPYTLPDALTGADGQRVTTVRQWSAQRRPELLALFAEHEYGKMPGRPAGMRFEVQATDAQALGGKAIRKQVVVFFGPGPDAPRMDVLLFLPKTNGKVPIFAGLNFWGNHTTHADPAVAITPRWVGDYEGSTNHRATEAGRGKQASRWQVETVLARGYGVATAYYGDLEPDYPNGYQDGIRTALKATTGLAESDWGAIGAWAWGLSRMLDYLETDPNVDARRVILHGHSRLGKAALWAGANDERFAAVIANESGEGGAALARRNFGETVWRINTAFPHWFVGRFKTYNNNEAALPVDQHELLALVAPRPLYVASAEGDQWADPRGEFLSAVAVGPVYQLFGKTGLGTSDMPPVSQPVGQTVRYHVRTGKHDITAYDWAQYLDFADALVKK